MKILAIDPGSTDSAWVGYDAETEQIFSKMIAPNRTVLREIDVGEHAALADICVCELVAHYGTGQPVGMDIFQTCIWFGQFQREWERRSEWQGAVSNFMVWMKRKEAAAHLCNSARANDSQIRQALIDRFGPGCEKAIGTKKKPGPLYGIKSHLWSALALAVTYADKQKLKQLQGESQC